MIFKMPTITFFLRGGMLYCRVSFNGSSSEFSCREKIAPKDWNQSKQMLVKKSPQQNYVNTLINSVTYKLKTQALMNDSFTARELIAATFEERNTVLLTDILSMYIDRLRADQEPGTIRNHEIKLQNLIQYQDHTKTKFTNVSFNLQEAEKFLNWFCVSRNTTNVTSANRNVLFYKNALIYANKIGKIPPADLVRFQGKKDKPTKPKYLSTVDFQRLQEYRFQSSFLQKCADLFIFQALTGMAYADLYGSWELVKKNDHCFIFGTRGKNGQEYFVPCTWKALEILSKYDHNLPKIANATYNRALKEIGSILGFEVALTTHVGRKTFATLADANGYSRETVAKMLGHASIKTTEQYYIGRSFERVEKEFFTLNDKPL